MTMVMMMTLTSAGRQGMEGEPLRPMVAHKRTMQEGHSLPPDQQEATSPLHLSSKGENPAGPLRVGLDPRAEDEDT